MWSLQLNSLQALLNKKLAILHPEATYEEFIEYTQDLKGPKSESELKELWEWRQKLLGLQIVSGKGYRSQLPADEQDLTLKQRETKLLSEARAQGKDPVYVGERWV